MTRNETIQILSKINDHCPSYFKNMKQFEKTALIEDWQQALAHNDFDSVAYALNVFWKTSKLAPFPREIKRVLEDHKKEIELELNPWYKHFPRTGEFFYNDKQVAWATFEDWNNIPHEMKHRMHYRPDPNDEIRNALLAEAEALKEKMRKERLS